MGGSDHCYFFLISSDGTCVDVLTAAIMTLILSKLKPYILHD